MATPVSSLQNPVVKEVRALYSKKARRAAGQAVVEGVHPLEEALRAGWRVVTVLYAPRLQGRPEGQYLLHRLEQAGARLVAVTEEVLDRVAETDSPQGVVATVVVREASLADVARPGGLLVVCDGLQDPGNLGTIWRTAHAFGAAGLVLTAGSVEPFNPKIIRSAAGSVFHLPVVTGVEPARLLAALRRSGYRVAVADAGSGLPPDRQDLTGPLALVIGSEAAGPSAPILDGADVRLRIAMPGEAESLNAAVAGAILLYEAVRRRLAAAPESGRS
ncbi:MAG: TrmH family RNA methyltransferase [Bacillota bacterium]